MRQMTLTYPDDLAQAARLTQDELERRVPLMAAIKMFEVGLLSSGKAAELAGVPRVKFLEECSRYRVSPYNYPPEEARCELLADVSRGCDVI